MSIMAKNAIVYSCVTTLARSFQEAPLVLETYNPVDDMWEQSEDNVFLDPFYKNPDLSASEINQYIITHLELTGKYFLWKWRSDDGMVREIWPVPPSWVTINPVPCISPDPDAQRLIQSFTIKTAGGCEYHVLPDDMAYGRFPDPTSLWRGLSPLQAAARNVYLDEKGDTYKAEAMTALSLPGLAIKTKKPLNPNQKADLRAALRRKIGKDVRENAILISGDDASIEMLNPMNDFEWESYTDLNETRICMVFGVPPIVIGALVGLKNSPWSNTGEARRWMYRNTMTALWEMVAINHTRDFIPIELQGKLRYRYRTDDVKELQEDIKERTDRAHKLFRGGIITREEAREILGYDAAPIQGGVFIYSLSDVLTTAGSEVELGADTQPLTPEEQAAGVEMQNENNASENTGGADTGSTEGEGDV
jgi:HK97 family phage portal protein